MRVQLLHGTILGGSYSGIITVSKTEDRGSIPLLPVLAEWCNGSISDSDSEDTSSILVLAVLTT